MLCVKTAQGVPQLTRIAQESFLKHPDQLV